MMALFVGVDPGKGGGIAILDQNGVVLLSERMPETDADLLEILLWPSREAPMLPCRAVIEKVASSPQMGVASAFSFGVQFGRCCALLTAARLPFDMIAAAKWQRRLDCFSEGDKRVTRARALQLFPSTKVTHYIADALLLAEYCRRESIGERTTLFG